VPPLVSTFIGFFKNTSLVVVIGLAWSMFGPGKRQAGKQGDTKNETVAKGKKKRVAKERPNTKGAEAKNQSSRIFACQIYTPEPGFFVLVDGWYLIVGSLVRSFSG
jgi:hypothetical protein